jgi:hypothetical protein
VVSCTGQHATSLRFNVSKDENVDRASVTNSATRLSTIAREIGASTGAKSGTSDSPDSELSHEA